MSAHHWRGCRKNGKPTCGGTFRCTTCKRTVGWCKGAADYYPTQCDECANRHYREAERRAKGATKG